MSRVSIILCILLTLVAISVVAVSLKTEMVPLPAGEQHTMVDLQVLALGMDAFHYEFRDEHGTVFWAHFCHDYEPQFSPGMTLTVLTYQDMGECWSVKDTHPAYLIKRDNKGKIIKEDFHDRPEETTSAAGAH